jgi:hypothetical protein
MIGLMPDYAVDAACLPTCAREEKAVDKHVICIRARLLYIADMVADMVEKVPDIVASN